MVEVTKKLRCRSCGTYNPIDAHRCLRCPYTLYDAEEVSESESNEEVPAAAEKHDPSPQPASGECPNCQLENPPGSTKCARCSTRLNSESKEPQLVWPWGVGDIPQPLRIGREPGFSPISDRLQMFRSISGYHAEIVTGPSGVLLTDLNSRNGTFVDGRRLEPHKAERLRNGMTVRFGWEVEVLVKSKP